MRRSVKMGLGNEKGFAFVAALLLTLLLTSLGILVFALTTRDVRTSIRMTGEKMALANAESGIHLFIDQVRVGGITGGDAYTVSSGILPGTGNIYHVSNMSSPYSTAVTRSMMLPEPVEGHGAFVNTPTNIKRVTGVNSNFGSRVDIEVQAVYLSPTGMGGYPKGGG
jgi:hypothetical protein